MSGGWEPYGNQTRGGMMTSTGLPPAKRHRGDSGVSMGAGTGQYVRGRGAEGASAAAAAGGGAPKAKRGSLGAIGNDGWRYQSKQQLERDSVARNSTPQRPWDMERERRYRSTACSFMVDLGKQLKLKRNVEVAVAHVLFHRFFSRQSFLEYDRFHMGITCVFLACKIEESTKKKLRDVVDTASRLLKLPAPDNRDTLREQILVYERVLLHTIAFEICIFTPYAMFHQISKYLFSSSTGHQSRNSSFSQEKISHIRQLATQFINDSMRTTLVLQYPPGTIAAAATHLAAKFVDVQIQDPSVNRGWWQEEKTGWASNRDDIIDVCHQMLGVFELPSTRGGTSANNATAAAGAAAATAAAAPPARGT